MLEPPAVKQLENGDKHTKITPCHALLLLLRVLCRNDSCLFTRNEATMICPLPLGLSRTLEYWNFWTSKLLSSKLIRNLYFKRVNTRLLRTSRWKRAGITEYTIYCPSCPIKHLSSKWSHYDVFWHECTFDLQLSKVSSFRIQQVKSVVIANWSAVFWQVVWEPWSLANVQLEFLWSTHKTTDTDTTIWLIISRVYPRKQFFEEITPFNFLTFR